MLLIGKGSIRDEGWLVIEGHVADFASRQLS